MKRVRAWWRHRFQSESPPRIDDTIIQLRTIARCAGPPNDSQWHRYATIYAQELARRAQENLEHEMRWSRGERI